MNSIEITGMSKAEKLQTMEALWDSLIHESFTVESPEWHQSILGDRKLRIEEGKASYISIERLRAKRGG